MASIGPSLAAIHDILSEEQERVKGIQSGENLSGLSESRVCVCVGGQHVITYLPSL